MFKKLWDKLSGKNINESPENETQKLDIENQRIKYRNSKN